MSSSNGRAYGEPNPADKKETGCLAMLGSLAVIICMWPLLGLLSHAAYWAFMLGWNLL